MVPAVLTIGTEPNPAKRLRHEWAASLSEHLTVASITRKELQRRLRDENVDVSLQTIGNWLRGEWSPRPHHQAAIAKAICVPARRLFPLEAA